MSLTHFGQQLSRLGQELQTLAKESIIGTVDSFRALTLLNREASETEKGQRCERRGEIDQADQHFQNGLSASRALTCHLRGPVRINSVLIAQTNYLCFLARHDRPLDRAANALFVDLTQAISDPDPLDSPSVVLAAQALTLVAASDVVGHEKSRQTLVNLKQMVDADPTLYRDDTLNVVLDEAVSVIVIGCAGKSAFVREPFEFNLRIDAFDAELRQLSGALAATDKRELRTWIELLSAKLEFIQSEQGAELMLGTLRLNHFVRVAHLLCTALVCLDPRSKKCHQVMDQALVVLKLGSDLKLPKFQLAAGLSRLCSMSNHHLAVLDAVTIGLESVTRTSDHSVETTQNCAELYLMQARSLRALGDELGRKAATDRGLDLLRELVGSHPTEMLPQLPVFIGWLAEIAEYEPAEKLSEFALTEAAKLTGVAAATLVITTLEQKLQLAYRKQDRPGAEQVAVKARTVLADDETLPNEKSSTYRLVFSEARITFFFGGKLDNNQALQEIALYEELLPQIVGSSRLPVPALRTYQNTLIWLYEQVGRRNSAQAVRADISKEIVA